MEHLQHESDLFLDLTLVPAHEPTLGVDPLSLSVTILLLEQLDGLLDGDVVRFGMVSYLIIVSLGDVHVNNVPVLLLLEEPFLILGLEDVPSLVF